MFIYLSLLGTRFRHPSEWGSVSFQTIDCSASSIVFAYALYLSCTSLRRNECRSPRDVFESTHKVILSTLDQSEALCDRVKPVEITWLLRKSMRQEHQLAVLGEYFDGFHDRNHPSRLFFRLKYRARFQRPSRLCACVYHIPKTRGKGWCGAHLRMFDPVLFSL